LIIFGKIEEGEEENRRMWHGCQETAKKKKVKEEARWIDGEREKGQKVES